MPQVTSCFNESVLADMKDSTVTCAGAVLGGRYAIRAYLQLLLDVLHLVTKESCKTSGADQGIHNYILHYLRPRRPDLLRFDVLQLANDDSPIYTVGITEPARVDISDGGFAVYNQKGAKPPLLHQVDRHDKLYAFLQSLAAEGI